MFQWCRWLIAICVVSHALGIVRPASACVCVRPDDSCAQVLSAHVVLMATVTGVEPVGPFTPRSPWDQPQRVRALLADIVTVRGATTPTSVLTSNNLGCAVDFRVGEPYLIVGAYDPSGNLTTSLCSGTRPLEDVAPLVRHVQDVTAGRARGALIWGNVVGVKAPGGGSEPMPGARISVTGPDTREVTVDGNGRFVAEGMTPGTYRVGGRTSSLASFLPLYPRAVTLASIESCTEMTLVFERGGRIEGQVNGPDGKPLPDVDVVIMSQDDGYGMRARTSADGRFSFPRVDAGRYSVTIDESGWLPTHAPTGPPSRVIVREGRVEHVTLAARPVPPGQR